MRIVPLRARIMSSGIRQGDVCPVCGEGKSSRGARTCRSCYDSMGGNNITAVVDAVLAAYEAAAEAQRRVAAKGYAVVFGPELAWIKLDKNARLREVGGGVRYFECIRSFKGGVLNICLFGAEEEDLGRKLTVLVELKTKVVTRLRDGKRKSVTLHYLRAQVVREVRSDVSLVVVNRSEADQADITLPMRRVVDEGRTCVVGFAPVVSKNR